MNLLDDILDFLHYHPTSGRGDIANGIAQKASPATLKRVLAEGVHRGLVSVSGLGRATVYSRILMPSQEQGESRMQRYVCKVCGYVYDPAENNSVAFADLPADWVCPLCGVGKDMFEPLP